MAIYSVARRTSNVTNANAALEIIASASVRPRILEIGLTLAAATASVYGLGFPAATGITPTTPVTVVAEDVADDTLGTTQTALAWGTGPTVPTDFLRRVSLKAEIGAGIVWTFPRGLVLPVSTSLVLWNLASNGAVDAWIVVDE